MKAVVFCFVAFALGLCSFSTTQATSEAVLIEVKHREVGENGVPEETVLKVGLFVDIKDGVVHINGRAVNHSVVTALHTRVELDQYSTSGVLLRHTKSRLQVRVLVSNGYNAKLKVKTLTIQEEIVEVDRATVTQIDVKEVVLHLDTDNKEVNRIITAITLSKSKIHKIPRNLDFHIHGHGKLPHRPFHATRNGMKFMHRAPPSHLRPPHLPRYPLKGRDFEGDDDEDFMSHGHSHGDRHGRHRHHHGKKFGKKVCRWFHRLPVGVRIVMLVAVVFVGLVGLTCCVRCCRKRRAANAYDVAPKMDTKMDLYDDEGVDTAGPLPVKTSLDKAQLIVST